MSEKDIFGEAVHHAQCGPVNIGYADTAQSPAWDAVQRAYNVDNAISRKKLRDDLAAQMLVGLLACPIDHLDGKSIKDRVKVAYKYADALLEARDAK